MPDNTPQIGFAHERLDAYQVARQLAVEVQQVAKRFPRGYASLRRQLERASAAVPLLIAEGANRETRKDKNARFVIARGEAGECDAALEIAIALELICPVKGEELRGMTQRVGAMLTGLIRHTG
jgi:four helix bundle protein